MWKQNISTLTVFGLYGVILFNGATILHHVFKRNSSPQTTCDRGNVVIQCPTRPSPPSCRRPLDEINPERGRVLGIPREHNVFLSIGVVSAEGDEDRVMRTLHQLTPHISSTEYSDVVIVVVCERGSSARLLERVKADFQNEVVSGLIHVIHPTEEYMKMVDIQPLGWRYMKYSEDFKKKATELNKRFFFLAEYCFRISTHYLHLCDQVRVVKPFLPVIKQEIAKLEEQNSSLYASDFGEFSFADLGRLLSKEMTADLADFGSMFPSGRVAMEIIDHQYGLRGSAVKTGQPGGEFLFSLRKELRGVKPEVEFRTTFRIVGDQNLDKAFNSQDGFTWLELPKKGENFVMIFKEPIVISRVRIDTGTPLYRDSLNGGALLACKEDGQSGCDESQCTKVAEFQDPFVDVTKLDDVLSFSVKCLKLAVMEDAKSWVIIRDISVWGKE